MVQDEVDGYQINKSSDPEDSEDESDYHSSLLDSSDLFRLDTLLQAGNLTPISDYMVSHTKYLPATEQIYPTNEEPPEVDLHRIFNQLSDIHYNFPSVVQGWIKASDSLANNIPS